MPTGYDENLVASVPAASRADMQAGYNLDLLENREPTPALPRNVPASPGVPDPVIPGHAFESDVEYGNNSTTIPKEYASAEDGLLDHKRTTSFWRTTRAKVTLAVLIAVVIIAAVIGGAVGATAGKKSSHTNATTAPSPSHSSPLSSSTSSNPLRTPAPTAVTITTATAGGASNTLASVSAPEASSPALGTRL
ncbi:hypothetical protein BS47DRAFT_1350784 [Hydnum rufescens UP504]|uniref:Uncharacterized protein n=1 Tax=Hydnum rufescens UP504 TaxID=1448309 RepID=A0A9P6DMK8_9AGAM|nr:hypothetical protein BS47DRAFT_1350784 [Hydnum rufescens UP504]